MHNLFFDFRVSLMEIKGALFSLLLAFIIYIKVIIFWFSLFLEFI